MIHHPCVYSGPVVPEIVTSALKHFSYARLWIDPFAGRDGVRLLIQELRNRGYGGIPVVGVEIEEEWAKAGDRTVCGDSATVGFYLAASKVRLEILPYDSIVVTSPAYGGRMADQYLGTPAEQALRAETGKMPRRRSYAISLGRKLTEGSGAAMQWGPKYRELHGRVILNWVDWGVAGAVINISDHYRKFERQPVTQWWIDAMTQLADFELVDRVDVPTARFRDGENSDLRADSEAVLTFKR